MAEKQEKIGALWSNQGSKGEYLSGVIGGKNVVCFHNDYKKTDKQPDWNVFPQKERTELPPKRQDDDEDEVPF